MASATICAWHAETLVGWLTTMFVKIVFQFAGRQLPVAAGLPESTHIGLRPTAACNRRNLSERALGRVRVT
jgi:hypothetical protein